VRARRKGTVSVAQGDTLWIARDGRVIVRLSTNDPANGTTAETYTAPFSATITPAWYANKRRCIASNWRVPVRWNVRIHHTSSQFVFSERAD
jgi:hypothetical protein